MLNLNNCFFHFVGGYQVLDTTKSIEKLKSILNNGYILSREKQKLLLNTDYSNNGRNWNGEKYISICKIGKCNDEYEDYEENAYDTFCYTSATCIILDHNALYKRRKNYWHMQGEIQVEDIINSNSFKGIGIQFNSYFDLILNEIPDKRKLELLKADIELFEKIQKIAKQYPIYSLNNGELASDYLKKEKQMVK